MSIAEQYSADYYERGVELKLSGYTNYHWRPEYCMPFANELKRRYQLGGKNVFDFGCAKGYLVKAFRLLGVSAFGFDISKYAIDNCDPSVREFVFHEARVDAGFFAMVTAKDVLEHVAHDQLAETLASLSELIAPAGRIVVTVPLGDGKTYRIREYELDKTHVIREDEEWWINTFRSAGLQCDEFYYDFPGAKDHWLKVHPHGNGTFILRKQGQ